MEGERLISRAGRRSAWRSSRRRVRREWRGRPRFWAGYLGEVVSMWSRRDRHQIIRAIDVLARMPLLRGRRSGAIPSARATPTPAQRHRARAARGGSHRAPIARRLRRPRPASAQPSGDTAQRPRLIRRRAMQPADPEARDIRRNRNARVQSRVETSVSAKRRPASLSDDAAASCERIGRSFLLLGAAGKKLNRPRHVRQQSNSTPEQDREHHGVSMNFFGANRKT